MGLSRQFALILLLPLVLIACEDSEGPRPEDMSDEQALEWGYSDRLPETPETPPEAVEFVAYEPRGNDEFGDFEGRGDDFGVTWTEVLPQPQPQPAFAEDLPERPASRSVYTGGDSRNRFANYSSLAQVVLVVDKATSQESATGQSVTLFQNGRFLDRYPVSTGQEQMVFNKYAQKETWTGTPAGYYRPERIYKDYLSRAWGGSPMPNAVFFHGGIAFHGTYELQDLGSRASGGCIRLDPEHARRLRVLVQGSGSPENAWLHNEDVESLYIPGKILARVRILGTAVYLPAVDQSTGRLLETSVSTWDTVVVVLDGAL